MILYKNVRNSSQSYGRFKYIYVISIKNASAFPNTIHHSPFTIFSLPSIYSNSSSLHISVMSSGESGNAKRI